MAELLPALLRQVRAAGHTVFTGGPGAEDFDLNLIAQRSASRTAGLEDDLLSLVWREGGRWKELAWPCSTDPGRHFLQHPENKAGTAIIQPGQYHGAYQRGLHKGRPALVQVGPVRIRRDGDLDVTLDPPSPVFDGVFAVNIHDDAGVGAEASAGCIVLPLAFESELLSVVALAEARWGPRVTLTLLEL